MLKRKAVASEEGSCTLLHQLPDKTGYFRVARSRQDVVTAPVLLSSRLQRNWKRMQYCN